MEIVSHQKDGAIHFASMHNLDKSGTPGRPHIITIDQAGRGHLRQIGRPSFGNPDGQGQPRSVLPDPIAQIGYNLLETGIDGQIMPVTNITNMAYGLYSAYNLTA